MPDLHIRPVVRSILIFGLLPSAWCQFQPKAFKVAHAPAEVVNLQSIMQGKDGWVVSVQDGYLQQQGLEWQLVNPEGLTETQVAIPYNHGVVCAGNGIKTVRAGRSLGPSNFNDYIYSGLSLGDSVLLAGSNGAYLVDAAGLVREVFHYPKPVNSSFVRRLGQHVALSTFSPNETYVWSEGKFILAPDSVRLTATQGVRYWIGIENTAAGTGYYFDGRVRLPETAESRAEEAALAKIWPEIAGKLTLRRLLQHRDLLLAPAKQGLLGFSRLNGQQLWSISSDSFDGIIRCMAANGDGVLVETAGSLFLLPDPDYVSYVPTPRETLLKTVQTSQGFLVISETGSFYADGRKFTPPVPSLFALLELSSGELVCVDQSLHLSWNGVPLPLPSARGRLYGMMEINDGRIAILYTSGLTLLDRGGNSAAIPLDFRADSMAFNKSTGDLLLGTDQGAKVLDITGRVKGSYGRGDTSVFQWHGGAMALDADGTWFGPDGKRLGKLPFSGIYRPVEWRGQLCIQAQFPGGSIWAGIADPASGSWRPLDIPFQGKPVGLGTRGNDLLEVLSGETMAVSDVRFLPPPNSHVIIRTRQGDWSPQTVLGPNENEVELQLPVPRLAPWRNPDYAMRLGTGDWQNLAPGATVRIPRLSWGRTDLTIRAFWAGMESTSTYAINRAWPWWLSWPGWLVYGSTLALSGYGLVHWRTRRLERQTRELEQLVTRRTSELSAAKAELETVNALKSEFIASMNHEIRNPMNGILGLTRILGEEELKPCQRSLLATLEACTEQLRSTMDDVLDFRFLEKGGVTLAEGDFELGSLVGGCCAAADIEENRIQLHYLPASAVWLRGDHGKFRQILGNYLSNALKYGLPPHAEVAVEVTEAEAEQVRVNVRVTNQGPTLGPDELNKLFSLFYRGSRAKETGANGTGLGLAVCRRLAEAMGGSTGVTSEHGLTSFWVNLPFARTAEPTASTPVQPTGPEQPGGRVLATEDEVYNRLVLGHYLKKLGFEVDWAERGELALSRARSHQYRLIVTDWFLPDMDGGTLIGRLREIMGEKMPPVLVISAYATAEKKAEALAAGAGVFITKPVEERKLAAALAELRLRPASAAEETVAAAASLGHFDFSTLLALGEKAPVMADYVRQLDATWSALVSIWTQNPPEAGRLAHRLRSQILLARAVDAAEQLQLLERGLAGNLPQHELAKLVDCAGHEVAALLAAARKV